MCWYKVFTMIIIIIISINIIIILLHLWVLLLQHNLNAGKQSKFLMSVEQRKHWKYSWQLSIHWRKSNTNPVIPLKVFWLLNRREKTSKKLYNLVTLNIGNFSTNFQKKKKPGSGLTQTGKNCLGSVLITTSVFFYFPILLQASTDLGCGTGYIRNGLDRNTKCDN